MRTEWVQTGSLFWDWELLLLLLFFGGDVTQSFKCQRRPLSGKQMSCSVGAAGAPCWRSLYTTHRAGQVVVVVAHPWCSSCGAVIAWAPPAPVPQ